MKPALIALFVAAGFSACSVQPKQNLQSARAAGVPDATFRHLRENDPLSPTDIIELKRRGVPDDVAIRHLETIGIDYEVRKEDIERLRAAKVSDAVRDAFARAGDRYAYWRYNAPQTVFVDRDPWMYPVGFGLGYTYVRHYRRCR
jgi:hypothetical protein